jgi:hypothetical protein
MPILATRSTLATEARPLHEFVGGSLDYLTQFEVGDVFSKKMVRTTRPSSRDAKYNSFLRL